MATVILAAAPPAQALRILNYNLLNYPGPSGTARAPYFRTVLGPLGSDVVVAHEISSAAGPSQFLNEVLNVLEPDQWTTQPLIDGNDTDSAIFYKSSRVTFLGQSSFYPNPANHLRLVHVFRFRVAGYESAGAEFRIYACHLKASQGYESQRLAECIGIRDSLNALPDGSCAFLMGDLNFYTQNSEPGYERLVGPLADNSGRLSDLLPAGAWHDGPGFAFYHTQSTCRSGGCASGAATGGLDDRFDFTLPTYTLTTGQGLSVLPGTCIAVGNDGQHLNKAITETPVIPEGSDYATALQLSSDHLPLRIDVQAPAMLAAADRLVFPTVIVGAPEVPVDLIVDNPALPPADTLDCSVIAPTGFTAPPALTVPAQELRRLPITLSTAQAGYRAGDLQISSDAPDSPLWQVSLSGHVLEHAMASLDSASVVTELPVDFGDHAPGGFVPHPVAVHNFGFGPDQARLLVSSATFSGSERFSLAEPFEPVLVAGTPLEVTVIFDDGGLALDSTFTARLTFTCADEPLPGATSLPSVHVDLRARLLGGESATPGPVAPVVTRLYAPAPNPAFGAAFLRLDLAGPAAAEVSVFDASGRHVADLRRGALARGTHQLVWDGRLTGGAEATSGVYFVRLRGAGMATQTVRFTLIR